MVIIRADLCRSRDTRFPGLRRVALVLALVAAPCAGGELEAVPGVPAAPVLQLDDPDGHPHRLADYLGRVVLVNFWGTWCAPCVAEMPSLQRLQDSLAGKPFRVLTVNLGENRPRVRHFKDQHRLSFDFLIDAEGDAAQAWGVEFIPSSFVVDARGRLRYRANGALGWDEPEVRERVKGLVGEIGEVSNLQLGR